MAGKQIDMKLPTLDDVFSSQEERNINAQTRGKVLEIPLGEIDDFPDHPFEVREDEDMALLVESIRERGLITPATVRRKEDGRYELISGHRRRRACELAGLATLKVEVLAIDRDAAIVLMVDANLQRTNILPSEKAKAYKMKMDAMKRQGQRSDLTSAPVARKLRGVETAEIVGDQSGESKDQVRRYIRLNELSPDLLQMVDDHKIAFRPAVELSHLQPDEQKQLLQAIEMQDCTPSLSQAQKLKKFSQEGKLDENVIDSIMTEEKPNQREKVSIPYARLRQHLPTDLTADKAEQFVLTACDRYTRFLARNKDNER